MNSKISVNFALGGKVLIPKNYMDLKNLYFLNICRNLPYTSKINHQKENFKLNFFSSPKMVKPVFDVNNTKFVLSFSIPLVAGFKNVKKKFSDYSVTS